MSIVYPCCLACRYLLRIRFIEGEIQPVLTEDSIPDNSSQAVPFFLFLHYAQMPMSLFLAGIIPPHLNHKPTWTLPPHT